jgi:hypothetical protein
MILRNILKEYGGGGVTKCGCGEGWVVGCCEHGDEPSDAVKGEELHDQMSSH